MEKNINPKSLSFWGRKAIQNGFFKSWADIAARSGIHPTTISRVRNSHMIACDGFAGKIAAVLKVEPERLFEDPPIIPPVSIDVLYAMSQAMVDKYYEYISEDEARKVRIALDMLKEIKDGISVGNDTGTIEIDLVEELLTKVSDVKNQSSEDASAS